MEGREMKGCVCYYCIAKSKDSSWITTHVQECLLEGQLISSKSDRPKERRDKGEEREKGERERGRSKALISITFSYSNPENMILVFTCWYDIYFRNI